MSPTSHMPTATQHGEGGPLMLVPFTGLPPEVTIKALTALLATSASDLAAALTFHTQPTQEAGVVKPVVVYQMPPADGAAQGVKFDLTVVLCSLMNMLTTDLSRSQDVMAVMRLVASVGSSPAEHPNAALLLPTLRNDEVLMHNLVTLGFHWVERAAGGAQAQEPLNILAGFASPCNSADLPSARASVTLMRQRPNFRPLLEASLKQARTPCPAALRAPPATPRARAPAAPPARRRTTPRVAQAPFGLLDTGDGQKAHSAMALSRFWDALLGTPPQSRVDASALAMALDGLAHAPELAQALKLMIETLEARAAEAGAAARYGGAAPLLRITSALVLSTPLVATLHERGLLAPVEQLLGCLLRLAAASMRPDACAFGDLLAAMSVEVLAGAMSQVRVRAIAAAAAAAAAAVPRPVPPLRCPRAI